MIGMIDLTELELPDTMKTAFPDPSDVLNFTLTITPDEGDSTLCLKRFHISLPISYTLPLLPSLAPGPLSPY